MANAIRFNYSRMAEMGTFLAALSASGTSFSAFDAGGYFVVDIEPPDAAIGRTNPAAVAVASAAADEPAPPDDDDMMLPEWDVVYSTSVGPTRVTLRAKTGDIAIAAVSDYMHSSEYVPPRSQLTARRTGR